LPFIGNKTGTTPGGRRKEAGGIQCYEGNRGKREKSAALSDMVHTISPTVTENPANFSKQEIESKTHQIN